MVKVLIVDDSRLSTSALQNILGQLGHTIADVAHSGEEAVEKAKEHQVDVVCLDYVMPGMDGQETATKLKQVNPNIDIIMITQNEVDKQAKDVIKALHYIVKPITKAKLKEAFSKV